MRTEPRMMHLLYIYSYEHHHNELTAWSFLLILFYIKRLCKDCQLDVDILCFPFHIKNEWCSVHLHTSIFLHLHAPHEARFTHLAARAWLTSSATVSLSLAGGSPAPPSSLPPSTSPPLGARSLPKENYVYRYIYPALLSPFLFLNNTV